MFKALKYLDTCTSDYFQGFSGHVYAIPLSEGMTCKEVLASLKQAINDEEIEGFEDNYNKIEMDCEGLAFIARESGIYDKVWNEYVTNDEESETVFSYFGVLTE